MEMASCEASEVLTMPSADCDWDTEVFDGGACVAIAELTGDDVDLGASYIDGYSDGYGDGYGAGYTAASDALVLDCDIDCPMRVR